MQLKVNNFLMTKK